MAFNPKTPARGGNRANESANSTISTKRSLSGGSGLSSSVPESPASTYATNGTDDSVLATPHEGTSLPHRGTSRLATISESDANGNEVKPAKKHAVYGFNQTDKPQQLQRFIVTSNGKAPVRGTNSPTESTASSPSKLASMLQEIARQNSSATSPTIGRVSHRTTPSFVQNHGNAIEDPFTTSSVKYDDPFSHSTVELNTTPSRRANSFSLTPTRQVHPEPSPSGTPGQSGTPALSRYRAHNTMPLSPKNAIEAQNEDNCPGPSKNPVPFKPYGSAGYVTAFATPGPSTNNDVASITNQDSSSFSPREDRVGEVPSVENAQGIFPPDFCIFVANLSAALSDRELEYAVHQAFRVYGRVYVKIRRDNNGMPYAFCQYETKQSAERAVTEGKNQVIAGRRCRTEVARVQRSLYVSSHDGTRPNEATVRAFLNQYGSIEAIWEPTDTEREIYKLSRGIWVRFAYFQDCRDAHIGMRNNLVFRVDHHTEHHTPRPRRSAMTGRGAGSPSGNLSGTNSALTDDIYSIYVGNLPPATTQQDLIAAFRQYGSITGVSVNVRQSASGNGTVVYAFIEFVTAQSATSAVTHANNRLVLNGYNLRVDRKGAFNNDFHGNLVSMSNGFQLPASFSDGMNQLGHFTPQFPLPLNYPPGMAVPNHMIAPATMFPAQFPYGFYTGSFSQPNGTNHNPTNHTHPAGTEGSNHGHAASTFLTPSHRTSAPNVELIAAHGASPTGANAYGLQLPLEYCGYGSPLASTNAYASHHGPSSSATNHFASRQGSTLPGTHPPASDQSSSSTGEANHGHPNENRSSRKSTEES